jgi:hypothetical protein
VLLVLALVALRYVDDACLPDGARRFVRAGIPLAAILLPLAFFCSILPAETTAPNRLIYLAYAGAVELAVALLVLGAGLLRQPR